MRAEDLLIPAAEGLYCPPGDFFIDPLRPAARAVVTHGHSDHARAGHGAVLATRPTLDIMAIRYGAGFAGATQAAAPGAVTRIGEVEVSLHPAGHVRGSAQVLMQWRGFRAVVSGDYKRAADPTCAPFEPLRCDLFVSEATFGLPVFRHPPALREVEKLVASAALFAERAHLVGAYPLGKAQRVMALLREAGWDRPIYLHGAMERLTEYYRADGVELGDVRKATGADRAALAGAIVICPPSAMQEAWARRFPDPVACFASGWMRVRARARQRGVELPLVISDHADWDELCATIVETGCSQLWITHGEEDALAHWATTRGLAARPLRLVGYGEEDAGDGAAQESAA
ncbi:MAG: ligase-associated DNA damage response exonuclease [Methylobacteriaceae bacterium]|nr:ligase-associated DNA damage response exonuclease [Methylobacteriaceae bacterium]